MLLALPDFAKDFIRQYTVYASFSNLNGFLKCQTVFSIIERWAHADSLYIKLSKQISVGKVTDRYRMKEIKKPGRKPGY
jgi:hypothetical protein